MRKTTAYTAEKKHTRSMFTAMILQRGLHIFVVFLLVSVTNCFQNPRGQLCPVLTSATFLKAQVNGNGEADDNEEDKKQRYLRRLRRCVDYPPLLYQDEKTNKNPQTKKRKTSLRIRRTATGLKALFTKRPPARTIPIPDEKEEKDYEASFLDFTMTSSSPFETDLLESIGASAKRTRLLKNRSYARLEPFEKEKMRAPPSLEDLNSPPSSFADTFWTGAPYRLGSFLSAYIAFPYITKFLNHFVTASTLEASDLDDITSKFGPGVSILYGTFISLTLSILYTRQQTIQDSVAAESAVLVAVTRNLLTLFRRDPEIAMEAGQCAADQVRTLVRGSRGSELMQLMYSDPYARMLELVDYKEQEMIDAGQMDLGGLGVSIYHSLSISKHNSPSLTSFVTFVFFL
jgi:hypothetical protein